MEQEFNNIYDLLYGDYIYDYDFRNRFRNEEYDFIRLIRKSINNADKRDRLRPDAKFFLLVNFHQLIVKPLIETDLLYRKDWKFDLRESIENDIKKIVEQSIMNLDSSDESQVSGHQIMNVIDKIWKELKTTDFKIWG